MIKRARYKKQGDLRYVQAGLKSSLSGIGFAATTQFGVWSYDRREQERIMRELSSEVVTYHISELHKEGK